MYEAYWNLIRKPFGYRVSVEDLYRSRALQSAALRLRYCLENNAGAAMVVGPSGVGKSTLMQMLKAEGPHLNPFIHLTWPRLTSTELSRMIVAGLLEHESVNDLTADALLVRQHAAIKKATEEGLHPVIVLDEAHLMTNDSLNDVVLPLLNMVETDYSVRLTIVLVGQPALASHVARNAQLRERIAVTASMSGLSLNETADYIVTQLQRESASGEIFTEDAVRSVWEMSSGNPRLINRLCDMALLVGFSDQSSCISESDIAALASEILPAAA